MKRVVPILLIATGAILAGCANDDSTPGGSGLLEATEIIVSAQNAGQVTQLNFDEGTIVNTGDTLLVIDPTKVQLELDAAIAGRGVASAQLEAARLELKRAKETEQYAARELDRVQRLVNSSTATQKQLDDVTHQHTTAKIAVASAQAAIATGEAQLKKIDADIARLHQMLDDAYPTAPGAGVITEKYTDFGNLLAPGRPIAKISQIDSVWVKVYLPMADFSEVKIGEQAKVNTEAGDTYDGRVTWTADRAEFTPKNVQTKKARADLVYAVKVKMANPDHKLKVGQPVFVTIGQ